MSMNGSIHSEDGDFVWCDCRGLEETTRKGTSFKGLHKKLFGTGNETTVFDSKKKKEVKALTKVKENTRTLAMVLRSERELLGMNKKQEMEISQLKFMQCLRRRAQRSVTKFFYYFLDRRVAALSSLLYDSDSLVGKLWFIKNVIRT